ncbi:putative F-box protein PP2-B12 [Rosa rugosa]|uniref:putative F-box protein PP2-B12 n=1 Tax=Rosa rugosa TaxID=74645 RepID=UPI002B406419|nr:putative F-box protein PP2-B12 [Rosa rugosa]
MAKKKGGIGIGIALYIGIRLIIKHRLDVCVTMKKKRNRVTEKVKKNSEKEEESPATEMQQQPLLDLQALPEGCIAHVISLTSPPDACRLSSLSKAIRSAAESDAVWEKFIPRETHEILSQSNSSLSSFPPKSKKELYMALCDTPILIDEGYTSFSLDKWSGKKCYMIAAKRLRIAWGDTRRYWRWKSLTQSRFKEVAELRIVCWLEIRGRIETSMLSPSTTYKAYLVYKLTESTERGWACEPVVVTVGARAYGFDYECPGLKEITAGIKHTAFLGPKGKYKHSLQGTGEAKFPNERRADGWLEMELGEYHCQGDEDGELEMICCEIETGMGKGGLIVQGIEIRPKRN